MDINDNYSINFFDRSYIINKELDDMIGQIVDDEFTDEIMRQAARLIEEEKHVVDTNKEHIFNYLTKEASEFAEYNNFNIRIIRKDIVGIIELVSDKICFEDFMNNESKKVFIKLNERANSVWYGIDKREIEGKQVDVIKITFGFDLYKK